MAFINQGILGGVSGKVGSVVGARWRGRNIIRSLPSRRNYTPTAAQEDQRERFGTVIQFLSPIRAIVSAFYGKKQGDKSAYNLATGYHLKEALLPNLPDGYVINYTKVLISKGDLLGLANPTVSPDVNQQLTISWLDNSGQGNAAATDELIVVVYNPTLELFETANPAGTRDLTTVQMPLPAYWAGQEVQVWATFVTQDRKLAATSSYLGAVTLT
ncbi:hypothetical protein FJ651_10540 [Paucihalobacter ruber]|uniref:Uncharacterized protein n=1 Tax=Paucihalobacter ruber TaxID=2567861 RepID=A0A506PH68_9FLAO|nr:DUF6266 family protein [Paucihalobacter ruber]TPV32745.1 hypothetical protein FJ651_10540 [Paucihalobacter ruber]